MPMNVYFSHFSYFFSCELFLKIVNINNERKYFDLNLIYYMSKHIDILGEIKDYAKEK